MTVDSTNDPLEDLTLKEEELPSDTDLSSTVGAFRTRFEKKRHERQVQDDISEKSQSIRHQRMMRALVSIRRSLIDVTRIDLGQRYKFLLKADDKNGWPRICICLIDSITSEPNYPCFQVTAHDRQERGIIEITYNHEQKPEIISLAEQSGLNKVPSILKKTTRKYLDQVAEIVLKSNKSSMEKEENKSIIPKDHSDFEEYDQLNDIEENLFITNDNNTDFLETLPEIDSLDLLPDLDSDKAT